MEDFVEEILGGNEADLSETLEKLRKKEFNYAVSELKQNLKKQKRCIICTLELPCVHYAYPEDMPSVSLPSREEFSLQKYTKGLDLRELNIKVISGPTETRKRFAIRFKEGKNAYVMSTSPRFRHAVPSTQRLQTLEQIEAYREQKLKKEIQRIQELKHEEDAEEKKRVLKEERRKKRAKKLKEQLEKYTLELSQKQEVYNQEREEIAKKTKIKDEKHKAYLEEQKKKLAEHQVKKPLKEKTVKEEKVSKHDPKKIYMNV